MSENFESKNADSISSDKNNINKTTSLNSEQGNPLSPDDFITAPEIETLSLTLKKMLTSENILKKDIPQNFRSAIKEIYKHINYLNQELNTDQQFNDEVIVNFIKNISSVGKSFLNLPQENNNQALSSINLGDHKIMKKLDFAWLCIHALNVDVAPGILRDGIIEPWNKKILESILKPGDNFINIGANFGYFTMLGASLVGSTGKVISFEANPMIYECLSYGIFYSGFPNIVDAHNIAVSNKEDVVKLYYSPVFSGGGSIINNINYDGNPIMESMDQCRIGKSHDTNKHLINGDWLKHSMLNENIKSDSLDNILDKYYTDINDIKLLQIDVEGAEKFVLDGSFKTLERFNPIILVEFDPHTVRDQVKEMDKDSVYKTFKYIRDLGYSFFKVNTNNKYEFEKLIIPQDLQNIPHCDLLCVPHKSEYLLESMNIL